MIVDRSMFVNQIATVKAKPFRQGHKQTHLTSTLNLASGQLSHNRTGELATVRQVLCNITATAGIRTPIAAVKTYTMTISMPPLYPLLYQLLHQPSI